jgi:hypothetical protein
MLEAALLNATISAVVTVTSWFVLHFLAQRREEHTRRKERALKRLEEQIKEFYGPLVGSIKRSRNINEVAGQKLPTRPDGLIDIMKFSESQDKEIWEFFLERYFLRINAKIVKLLETKLYLLDTEEMPDSFKRFLKHAAYLDSLYKLSKEKKVDSTSVKGEEWPLDFEEDAKNTLNDLARRYKKSLRDLTSRPILRIPGFRRT